MNKHIYPRIFDRVKAAFLDTIFIILLAISISDFFTFLETVGNNTRMISFIFVFVLYEPLFITLFGSSLGHMIIGLAVKRENNSSKNLYFHIALLRFLVKALLGWISLFTVNSNDKHKAIHDFVADSVVIYLGKQS